jgi:hypothetical protein
MTEWVEDARKQHRRLDRRRERAAVRDRVAAEREEMLRIRSNEFRVIG